MKDKSYRGYIPNTPIQNKSFRDSVPNTVSTFSRKKYQKLAPVQSPGVPLFRYSVRFFNSAATTSNTKNLFTLVPPRSTEISLMGPYKNKALQDHSLFSSRHSREGGNPFSLACPALAGSRNLEASLRDESLRPSAVLFILQSIREGTADAV
jgi:hypothetical protein